MKLQFEIEEDGDLVEVTEEDFPSEFAVCPDCKGHGSVLNESMRYHAYTAEEFSDFSEDEKEQYFTRGGMYDVTCPTCSGRRVVDVPRRTGLTPEQTASLRAYDSYVKRQKREAALARREHMMGY